MGAITERALLGVLTGAEVDRTVSLSLIRDRRESGPFVGTIAERLVLTVSTRAPVIGLTSFDEDGNRGLLRDMGGGHEVRVSSIEDGV
jgi:hypothetical protein